MLGVQAHVWGWLVVCYEWVKGGASTECIEK
jgi:hypothetical protein